MFSSDSIYMDHMKSGAHWCLVCWDNSPSNSSSRRNGETPIAPCCFSCLTPTPQPSAKPSAQYLECIFFGKLNNLEFYVELNNDVWMYFHFDNIMMPGYILIWLKETKLLIRYYTCKQQSRCRYSCKSTPGRSCICNRQGRNHRRENSGGHYSPLNGKIVIIIITLNLEGRFMREREREREREVIPSSP